MSQLRQRIESLEATHGPGVMGTIATKIIQDTVATDAGLTACGEVWKRQPGENDYVLRRRATAELLKLPRRALMQKVMLEQARAMWAITCPGSTFCIEGQKIVREANHES